ncbi:MAG: PhzF family phenazine biosynthesis protein [Firmicutes bacterium]|nr:PhzF family phenazine biosynthesis protein [Bacillota bacterium]
MEIEVWQVDAFTAEPFGGNPAGVVPDARGLGAGLMQKIAREMNLSETAFVLPAAGARSGGHATGAEGEGGCGPSSAREHGRSTGGGREGDYDVEVRFFTPTTEVDLCGHATIATFFALAERGRLPGRPPRATDGTVVCRQRTRAGVLPVQVLFDGDRPVQVMMAQVPPESRGEPGEEAQRELAACLGCDPEVLREEPRATPEIVSTGLWDLIVPVPDRRTLWSLEPDFPRLARLCRRLGVVSVHCFTFDAIDTGNGGELAVHCRDFAPAVGINEESATGTASGALGGYLALRGLIPFYDGVARLRCEQGHIMGRPSLIHVRLEAFPEGPPRVWVGGAACLVLEGRILLR